MNRGRRTPPRYTRNGLSDYDNIGNGKAKTYEEREKEDRNQLFGLIFYIAAILTIGAYFGSKL